ncbi:signal transduction protein with periplasmic or extracellular sensor domain [Pseudobacteriovorax antillogorgiicola]|uniref:histidine kinase n=2 Tax=Pseudobacteriovorax antillogorgiicola TaxID=1513793 RepID=A0A1Y6C1S5_9BACT|nr:signal transduction protein with periplasmic or extracellular sensor domain [Pseudobacteriovorax antillogorgiicola]SMF39650.1 signal transduction protein with periplasmic or extracellular sensor domain [Pseudobacteriovorax antillogorgiicola]
MVPFIRQRNISLSYRLLAGVLLGSSVLTFFITLFSLWLDYQQGVRRIEGKLSQIETLYLPGITQSLWDLNDDHVDLNLNGIINLGDIPYAYIETQGVIQYSSGTMPGENQKSIRFPVIYKRDKTRYDLGTLVAVASLDGVVDRLINQALFVFASSFVKTLILSAFMLILFHQVVTRHLLKISSYLKKNHFLRPSKSSRLVLDKKSAYGDELDQVVQAINQMHQEINQHFSYREKAEQELRRLNSSLEEEVKRRIKENERQQINMQNAARLSSLGEMAGSIAHEINNPLTIISGYVSMLRRGLKTKSLPEPQMEYIGERVESTIERITTIIQGLLRLSRDTQKEKLKVQAVNPIVKDALAICREKFSSRGIDIRMTIADEALLAPCKPVEIGQVVINLLNNAYDEVIKHTSPWVEVCLKAHEDKVILTVTDSGLGIPEHLRPKLLEPFFTTKPLGKGTGLGLSISRAIAEDHQGRLYLDEQWPNTRFVLELPSKEHADANPTPTPEPARWHQIH